VPKTVSKKTTHLASFKLHPLSATMRAAFRSGAFTKQRSLITPVLIASAVAVGGSVTPTLLAPASGPGSASVMSQSVPAVIDSLVSVFMSKAHAQTQTVTSLNNTVQTVSTTNSTVNATIDNRIGSTGNISIVNNSETKDGNFINSNRGSTNVTFNALSRQEWGNVSLQASPGFTTNFIADDDTFSSLIIQTGAPVSGFTSNANVYLGNVQNGISGDSFGQDSSALISLGSNSIVTDGSNTHAIDINGASNLSLSIVNAGLVSVDSSVGNDQGSAIYATAVRNINVTNQLDASLQGVYAGIELFDVGATSGTIADTLTVEITNRGNITGQAGIYINGVLRDSRNNEKSGSVVIRNENDANIVGGAGVGISISGVTSFVQITNNGTIAGSGSIASDLDEVSGSDYLRWSDGGSEVQSVGAGIAIHRGTNDVVSASRVSITNEANGEILGIAKGAYGVFAEADGPITVNTSGLIQGNDNQALFLTTLSDTANDPAIRVTIGSGGLVQTLNSSLSLSESLIPDPASWVVYMDSATSSTLTIENGGNLTGRVEMYSDNGDTTFTNRGTWTVSGAGEDGFYGDASGEVNINNQGTIVSLGNTTFLGLTNFDNRGGLIDLTKDSNVTNSILSLDFSGSHFFGQDSSLESRLMVQANLSGTVSTNYSTSVDRLVLAGSNVTISGVTGIVVNDTNPLVAGVNDPYGQVVVIAQSNTTAPGAFVMSGGPRNKGLWQYDIFYSDDGGEDSWWLASAPSNQAHELPVMHTAAQKAWHVGASALLDHTNNIRLQVGTENNAARGGAWARVIGSRVDRENANRYTHSVYDRVITQQNNYQQDIYGVAFGADGAIALEGGGTWLLGITGGALQSRVEFSTSSTEMRYTAGSLGAYASFVKGGGFFNALIKGDLGSTDYSMSNGAGISYRDDIRTSALGLLLDTGYRFGSVAAFFEPSLSVAAVSSSLRDMEFLATKVNFGSGSSLRSKLTFASGFSGEWNGTRFEPYLSLSVVHESDTKKNTVGLISNDPEEVRLTDKQVGTYGQIGLGLKVIGAKGSSGFISAEHAPSVSDKSSAADAKRESTTVSAGAKLTW